MIEFDSSKMSIEVVYLKSITTSLGGSITIEDASLPKGSARIPVPMATARAFIKRHKVTKYLIPVLTAIVRYDNHIVCMERHSLGSLGTNEQVGLDGVTRPWKSDSETNLHNLVIPATNVGNWFFDGRYVYKFNGTVADSVKAGTCLTEDTLFRNVPVISIDLQHLHNKDKLEAVERCCMAFVTKTGMFSVSPPIWKELSSVGSSQLSGIVSDEEEDDGVKTVTKTGNVFSFDAIDQNLCVNLNFALKAGNEIGRLFGYEHIEPLHLADLMIDLHTVNLPNIPKQVKSTYDIHMKFTHALAWLLGLSRKADTLDTYIVMRSLMKYLTQKGIFKASALNASHIFMDGCSVNDVKMVSISSLIDDSEEIEEAA